MARLRPVNPVQARDNTVANFYFDKDADLKHIEDRTVAIIGYGNQGKSQALNLRDSGIKVLIGSPSDKSADRARDDGFNVFSIEESVQKADILFMLLPDEVMPAVYKEAIEPHLRADMVLNFSHGYNIHYKRIVPPADVDVILIGPRMIGQYVRETFLNGTGYPSLVAIDQDASGNAKNIMLALSRGIGSTKMGVIESSFREETEIDLFSEQSGDFYVLKNMFEALVEAGYDRDVILMEMYASGELSEIFAAARDIGLAHQLKLHSRTSQYGQVVTARKFADESAIKQQFTDVINHIKNGEFAKEWAAEESSGYKQLIDNTNEILQHPMQQAENRVYKLLGRRDEDLVEANWIINK